MVEASAGSRSPAPSGREAAEYLAALCGIEPENFSFHGVKAHRARHGVQAMLARCRFVHLGESEAVAEGVPALSRTDQRLFRGSQWAEHLIKLHRAYLAGKPRTFHSPVHREPVAVIGEVVNEAQQIYLALHGEELFFYLFVGATLPGIYYPRRDLVVVPRATTRDLRTTLSTFLKLFLAEPERFARFVGLARAGRLRRAFVIGDMRPGHFAKESLAYIDAAHDELMGFLDRGGLLALIADWCSIDPLAVFPALAGGDVLSLGSERATNSLLDMGLDAHRVYRFKTHDGSAWLRQRFASLGMLPAPEAQRRARFRVMISIDAEKQRITNQVQAFRFVLQKLGKACARRGIALEVVWDGWTVPRVANEKDRAVMARIEQVIAAITDGLGIELGTRIAIFGRSSFAKVADVAACDLVLVTQGTGAVVPSWLLARPTIVYHVASVVSNRSDLSEDSAFSVDQRAIVEEAPGSPPTGPNRFAIALWGLDDALVRAVGDRLGLEREVFDQTETNAGTA
jgi:hypothetical protein